MGDELEQLGDFGLERKGLFAHYGIEGLTIEKQKLAPLNRSHGLSIMGDAPFFQRHCFCIEKDQAL